jgi:flagellar motility protein MotE (MotC chaperone)
MVDVVSGMRPQNAADILSVQDVEIAVKILGKLEPTKVSKIFNSMDKEISARLQKQYMNMKK